MTLSELRSAAVVDFIRADIRKWAPIARTLRSPK
jgi:hypothetical protein